jgi:hypothetical protein
MIGLLTAAGAFLDPVLLAAWLLGSLTWAVLVVFTWPTIREEFGGKTVRLALILVLAWPVVFAVAVVRWAFGRKLPLPRGLAHGRVRNLTREDAMGDEDKRDRREAAEHPADGTLSPEAENEAALGAPEPEQVTQLPDGERAEPEDGPTDENGLPLTEEEKDELAMPVAAVPASVNLDEVEAVDGFRLPRDQPEAEQARRLAEAEADDASRPEVAQRLADEAKARADEAAGEAERAQARADQVREDYEGPDRLPLNEGWRYVKPEPDPHEPV